MTRALPVLIAAMLILAASPRAAAQSSIELRSAAQVPSGAVVTLEQIAILNGPEAVALGAVVIPTSSGRQSDARSITLDEVRRAIDASGRINWGRLTLRGSSCAITMSPSEAPAPAAPQARVPSPAPVSAEGTLRAAIIARLGQLLSAEPDDLKAAFQAEDNDFLGLPTSGRRVEVEPTGSSDRLPLAVALYEGSHTVASRTIRVGVQVRRPVIVAKSAMRRGDTVRPDDIESDERWIGPTARPAPREQVVGATVQSRVGAGEPVMSDDVAPSASVSKGEMVTVRCISGAVVVKTKARALTAGHDGDLVQFQALSSSRTFFARMDGKGSAVVLAGEPVPADTAAARAAPVSTRQTRVAPPNLNALEAIR